MKKIKITALCLMAGCLVLGACTPASEKRESRFRHLKNLKEKNPRINTGFSSLFVSKTCCMESLAGNFFDFFI